MKSNGLAATLEALARAQPQKVALREPERAVSYETPWSESQWVAESLTDAEAPPRRVLLPRIRTKSNISLALLGARRAGWVVSQWMKRASEEGVEGLKHKPPPGATPRLSEKERARSPELLAQGAEARGFRGVYGRASG